MIAKMIGIRVQACRKKKGLTQEQLAEMVKITPHYLSALERGVYNIKLELLVDIMNYLDCSADEIFCDVVKRSIQAKASQLSEAIRNLAPQDQQNITAVVETMIKNAQK